MYNITKKELAHVRVESREEGVKHIVNAERQQQTGRLHAQQRRSSGSDKGREHWWEVSKVLISRTRAKIKANS